MNISAIKPFATRAVGRGLLITKKYSPEILTTVGVVGVVVGGVLAARATLKLEPIVEATNSGLAVVKNFKEEGAYAENPKQKLRDKTQIYTHATIDLVKLYGPAVTIELFSIVSILAAHGIMRRRNVALVAAYKTVESAFSAYRERVVEELGEEKDREFKMGLRAVDEVDEATGKVVKRDFVDPNKTSGYAKFFDQLNINWENNPEFNLMFLNAKQRYLNDRLQARGHMFLNEVYEALGFEHTGQGAVVGWVISDEGDNFIDFNIYDFQNQQGRMFVNGLESSILLDFNVDGVIYDKIDKKRR